ncbi:hypothetical protein GLOIN_2v1521383 [Rhizophagus clarus]|uniref:Uncharacterized protein n=1 Tax=Rhizophagus clarus TaxID=94130 RepID=A0A8H3QR12_9GLOM|nr:hypothetical protein GLOIN_2v1521383 [Rhizophagus clarus]
MSTTLNSEQKMIYENIGELHGMYKKLNSKQMMIYESFSENTTKVSYLFGILEERKKWEFLTSLCGFLVGLTLTINFTTATYISDKNMIETSLLILMFVVYGVRISRLISKLIVLVMDRD